MKPRIGLPLVLALSLVFAACSAGGAGVSPAATGTSAPAAATDPPSSPSPRPTPTPIAAEVNSAADAAALVIAKDPRFTGATELSSDMIGASRYWQATVLDGGAYEIALTLGWGDCPSGCIEQHTWVYRVTADGQVSLLEESGDPVPEGSFPPG